MDPSILCVLFALCSLTHAKKLILIDFSNSADIDAFRKFSREQNIDEWSFNNQSAVVVVSESEERWAKSNFKVKELCSNVEKAIERNMEENDRARKRRERLRTIDAPLDYFARYDQVTKWLEGLYREHTFATLRSIGKTFHGREMHVLRIGKGPEKDKPAIFIMSGLHSREWLAPATVIYFIDKFVKALTKSTDDKAEEKRIDELTDKYDWYFLVLANPDGYEHTFNPDGNARFWRKTRGRQPRGGIGADANRNFDVDFGGNEAQTDPHHDGYPGPYPFSEKCTANIRNFVLNCNMNGRIKLYYDVHTYGQLYFVPYAHTRRRPQNDAEVRRVAQLSNAALHAVNQRTFRIGTTGEILFSVSGTAMDWFRQKANVKYSYSLELYPEHPKEMTYENCMKGFLSQPADIEPSGKEIWKAIVIAAENIRE